MELRIAIEDPLQQDIVALLKEGERHSAGLYPPESNHHASADALRGENVRFFVARDAAGRAVATGALILFGPWAELKRMWVVPAVRGMGVSKAILAALEAKAREEQVSHLRLETGIENHAALALYAHAGFIRCDRFGDYRQDPLSVFMEKALG